MTSSYREQAQLPTSEEETTTTSSSSGEETQVFLGVLSSPSTDYLVQSVLGEGTFGQVTKCIKVATREMVAVKIMKDSNFTAEVQNEVTILEHLRAFDADRFNFVRCNDKFIDRGHICLEFEMLDMSLLDFVKKKPSRCLSVKEIRPILHQIATTLEFLRSQGIVHTDLKPDNIMMVDCVNQPLKIKMIDFGLARFVSEAQWGSYMQPRHYRSPEIILGFPYTPAIDMWSLGCIAAELFLGYTLYPGSCEYDMLRHVVQTQGYLPQKLLNRGPYTECFFRRKRFRCRRRWRLMTPVEYGKAATESYFKSLDDLKKVRPACRLSVEDTMAEKEDQENFVDLLKRMLHLHLARRITPSQLLKNPFITMNDLAGRYPSSFYVKLCCELMKVCQDQSLSSDNGDRQPLLNPQPSTSAASSPSLDQHVSHRVPPAWHSDEEHPLILGITSAVSSSLSIHDNQSPSERRQLSFSVEKEATQPELQLSVTSDDAQSSTGGVKPARKMSRDTSETSRSDDRIPESALSERKKKMDFDDSSKVQLLQNIKEEGPASAAQIKLTRKGTLTPLPHSGSRYRKRKSMNPDHVQTLKEFPQNSEGTPTEASSSMAKVTPRRKRTWATFIASHTQNRTPKTGSPENKRRKMNVLHNSKEATTEAPSSAATMKPRKKRTWATFIASQFGSCRSPDSSSPERKRRKTSLDEDAHTHAGPESNLIQSASESSTGEGPKKRRIRTNKEPTKRN